MVEVNKLDDKNEKEALVLTKADVNFLVRCRIMNFGLFDTVIVKDGSPVLAKRSEPQEKFD